MKFSTFTVLVAGAALASANPLVLVGHAEGGQALRPIPVLYPVQSSAPVPTPVSLASHSEAPSTPCGAVGYRGRFKQKADSLLASLGLGGGETTHVRVITFTKMQEKTPHSATDRVPTGMEASFEDRLEAALMNLQPWEAGAVAFVLGCGIGVLLRMFFVLTILVLRSFRAPSAPATDYYYYVAVEGADNDAEEVLVAPPVYTVAAATEKA
ncbi:hypothetical protein HMN09_01364400 [Mycena chlorophos]|uniref:Uncharacterized protein n=1 Tax=Mycena chlorophos TaxID=658473 RepID=A0A8H6RYB4_MYCCL|nr:hypothetical protein HMN09_01364400 [Mycena chlorophos]